VLNLRGLKRRGGVRRASLRGLGGLRGMVDERGERGERDERFERVGRDESEIAARADS
jgi:hypothetical protein